MKYYFLITFWFFSTAFSLSSLAANDYLDSFSAEELTEGVYIVHGPVADPTVKNQGFINNPAFIIVDSGVVVIDPGSSRAIGEMVLDEIKQISQLPVIAIFNTHDHGDHWLGNQAITNTYPDVPIYAHPQMIQSISDGAGKSWFSLMQQATDNAITGTEIVAPTHPVKYGDEIILGNHTFKIYHYGTSHTQHDIMIELIESKTVFLGDNVFIHRLPRLDDGDVLGNINAIKNILKTNSTYYIPGHGHSGDKSVPETYLEYLVTLYETVEQLYAEGLSDFEMKDQVEAKMEKFSNWYGFESELGKNISLIYLQIEEADF